MTNVNQEVQNTEVNENTEVIIGIPEVTENPEAVVTEKAPKVKAKKWYEEEGAFPYNADDVVQIIAGKDLLLRKAVVVKPSAKLNAVKAKLINPVTNEVQKTECSFDFDRLLVIESNGQQVNVPLTKIKLNESVAV